MIKKFNYSFLIINLLVTALQSCQHKDFCFDHSHAINLRVLFDWQNAPEAAPETMSFYLCPDEGTAPMRYEFIGPEGGTIRTSVGRYSAFCLNSDTENIRYEQTHSRESFLMTTYESELLRGFSHLGVPPESAPRAKDTEQERVALPPDSVWGSRTERIHIDFSDTLQTIVMSPEPLFCHYTVEVRGIENLKYTTGMSASLSTLSGGLHPYSGEQSAEEVTIPFGLSRRSKTGSATGSFLTFGHGAAEGHQHLLMVYAILMDGQKWYYSYDVTDQVHTAPNPRRVHILVEGLPLPKPLQNGGGFHPTVDGWQAIEVDVKM